MIIFFQELVLQLFLWMLKVIDGIMEIFSAIAGITDVTYHGQKVNIIEFIVGDSTVGTIFWCIFILAVGLTCIFAIVALVKNMVANNKTVSSIIGKFGLSLLGTLAMLTVVILGILISNAVLQLIAEIFQIGNTTKLSNSLFNACVGDWLNGYSIAEIDVSSLTVNQIFGDYNTVLFGIWPTSWKCNGMVNPNTFMFLPSMIASVGLIIALIIAVLNLAKRVYEIAMLYIVMPMSMSTLSLDDGARFKVWRESFITKIMLAYGTVFSVNIFILILPIITAMSIPGISGFGNSMFLIFMIVGGAMVIPAGQTLFARLFGSADDMHAGGGFLRGAFYGSRMAGMMTLGLVGKVWGLGKKALHRRHKDRGGESGGSGEDTSGTDSSDKYTESTAATGAEDGASTGGEGE